MILGTLTLHEAYALIFVVGFVLGFITGRYA